MATKTPCAISPRLRWGSRAKPRVSTPSCSASSATTRIASSTGILWERYSGPIRKLLNNPYVYRPFWRAVQRGGGDGWRERLAADNREVERAVASRDSFAILTRIFRRLYTLRNQIFHGGATWPAGFGRDQIRDGSNIMAALVPAILDIMRRDLEQNPDSDRWGRVAYPRINDRPE